MQTSLAFCVQSSGVILRKLHLPSLPRADLETIDTISYRIQTRRDFISYRGKLVKIPGGPFQQFTVKLLRLPIKGICLGFVSTLFINQADGFANAHLAKN